MATSEEPYGFECPLSGIQKGILYHSMQYKSHASMYLPQITYRISQNIDKELFFKAWEIVISRHAILRSAIQIDKEQMKMVVLDRVSLPFSYRDISLISNQDIEQVLAHYIYEDKKQPIYIHSAPLMRVKLFKLAKDDYCMIWTHHHILLGGMSQSLLTKEVFIIYDALLSNKAWDLPTPVPFYEVYQQMQHADNEQNRQHWRSILHAHANAARLPDTPAKKEQYKINKRSEVISITAREVMRFKDFAAQNDVTLNTLFQTAWGLLLSRYSNHDQVIFGAVRAYPKAEVGHSAGLFINTLPMSLSINPHMTLIELLQNVRGQQRKLRRYVGTPLTQIREWCKIPAEKSIFETIIDYKPASINSMIREELGNHYVEVLVNEDTQYSLGMELCGEDDSVLIKVHYNLCMYSADFIQQFIRHYKNILLQFLAGSDIRLSHICTHTQAELYDLLVAKNATVVDYPIDEPVHVLFEKQVKIRKNDPAVFFGGQYMTYQELNAKANQRAHFLVEQGLMPGDTVALHLREGFELILSVLAVIKAGGKYVSIDGTYPLQHRLYLLQDSLPRLVLSDGPLESELIASMSSCKNVNLNETVFDGYSSKNLACHVSSDDLMYMIYTSGTTRLPKGVEVSHKAAVNMAYAHRHELDITAQSRVLQFASFNFDVSVAEWTMALLSGACLYLLKRNHLLLDNLVNYLRTFDISIMMLSSSVLASLPRCELPALKTIVVGGEPSSNDVLRYWSRKRKLINAYGVSEACVASCMAEYQDKEHAGTIIGKPLTNTQLYVLDAHMQPSPVYVPGELYIAGCGLAKGYHNLSQLTQEKFIIPDIDADLPYSKQRLYKTGDIVQWLPDGNLQFIGRVDDLVKVRGHRIELGAIESQLSKYPQITQSCVILQEFNNYKQIIAYYIGSGGELDESALKEFLADRLPYYMLPKKIMYLESLPLSSTGKVDKVKLLKPNVFNSEALKAHTVPRNMIEEKIASIIKELIGADDFSMVQNFFEIGLDSLMIMQLSIRINEEIDGTIHLSDLFLHTTIRALAEYIIGLQEVDTLPEIMGRIERQKTRFRNMRSRSYHAVS